MVLEMKRALEDLEKGDVRGYRKLYDAVYEETYSRSILILQSEEAAGAFMDGFFAELFGAVGETDPSKNQEKWFWNKYYCRIRKQYHKLLAEDQERKNAGQGKTGMLSDIPGGFPLLHRIMLVMSCKDDFTAKEIAGIFGLGEEQVRAELEKLDKILPTLAKSQAAGVSGYMGSWAVFLVGAFRQIQKEASGVLADQVYETAAGEAGISKEPAMKNQDTFEYFIAEPELPEEEPEEEPEFREEPEPQKKPVVKAAPKPRKKPAPIVEEEPEEDDEDEEYDDEYDDAYEDDDEDDEYDDGRYDWDLEDDSRKMVILGVVIALVLVAVIAFAAIRLFGGKGQDNPDNITTEQEADDEEEGTLIIKGEEDGEDGSVEEEPEEVPEEVPEEETPEEEAPEETTLTMEVNGSSVNIRAESNTNSDILTQVTAGETVEVLGDPSQEWVQVRCVEQNNEEGYMMSQYLSEIAE